MKVSNFRVILILLMFLHGVLTLHAETPTYTAKPLHTTSSSSVYSKSGEIGSTIIPGGATRGDLAVPLGGGVSISASSSTSGAVFSSTSSYLYGGSRANLSFSSKNDNFFIGESHPGVRRRRVGEEDHPIDPNSDPVGEVPFMLMALMILGYAILKLRYPQCK